MQSSIWDCRHRQSLAAYPRDWDGQSTRFLALLLTRFTMRNALLHSRWALTPPFHPYLRRRRRSALCCTLCSLTAPGRYPASCPVELGLSSRAPEGRHLSDCLKNLQQYRNQMVSRSSNPLSPMKSEPSPDSSPTSSSSSDVKRLSKCSSSALSS